MSTYFCQCNFSSYKVCFFVSLCCTLSNHAASSRLTNRPWDRSTYKHSSNMTCVLCHCSIQPCLRRSCDGDPVFSGGIKHRPVESQRRPPPPAPSSHSVLQRLPASAASLSLSCDLFIAAPGEERSIVCERKMS